MAPTDRSRTPSDGGDTTKLAVAGDVGAPPLTVWLGSAMYTFPADRDIFVGRDRDCDIRFHDLNPGDLTLISRVHAILRFDRDQWVVVDKSQNGVYVSGSRAQAVPIRDRLSITLGSPRGPQLTFRVAKAPAFSGPRNPRTLDRIPDGHPDASPKTTALRPVTPPPARPIRTQPSRPVPRTGGSSGL
ncbi:MAG: FHA domain-containing protein, partial [Mycobacterium sp.]|uniref:FHA domain-containing protein n=1 Tax=Mycobacterium sp. TaxID=1785 RepID=UPI003C65FACF